MMSGPATNRLKTGLSTIVACVSIVPSGAQASDDQFLRAGDWRGPIIGAPEANHYGKPFGAPFEARCNDGEYLAGIEETNDQRLKSLRVICAAITAEGVGPAARRGLEFGTVGPQRRSEVCPAISPIANTISVKADGFDLIGVWELRLRCGIVASEPPIGWTAPEIAFGGYKLENKIQLPTSREPVRVANFTECPPGYALNGLHGRAGIFIHAVGAICRPLPVFNEAVAAPKMVVTPSADGRSAVFSNPTITFRAGDVGEPETLRLDWCKKLGVQCGERAAVAFCETKGFASATRYLAVENVGRTGLLSGERCLSPDCDAFHVIECHKSPPISSLILEEAPVFAPSQQAGSRSPSDRVQPAQSLPQSVGTANPGTGAVVFGDGKSGVRLEQGSVFRGCKPGFAPRKAGPSDAVCVSLETAARVLAENQSADERRDPKGAYGPKSCKSGFVWREAFEGDTVCVTPAIRALTREDNRLGPERRT